jgi:hypothetical protein
MESKLVRRHFIGAATMFFDARPTLLRTAFDTGLVSGALACCAATLKAINASIVPRDKT